MRSNKSPLIPLLPAAKSSSSSSSPQPRCRALQGELHASIKARNKEESPSSGHRGRVAAPMSLMAGDSGDAAPLGEVLVDAPALLDHRAAAPSPWTDPLLSCFPRPRWKEGPKRSVTGGSTADASRGVQGQGNEAETVSLCVQAGLGWGDIPGSPGTSLTNCITTPAVQHLPRGTELLLLLVRPSSQCHNNP